MTVYLLAPTIKEGFQFGIIVAFAFVLGAYSLIGCSDVETVCQDILKFEAVEIVNEDGKAVSSIELEIIHKRTGGELHGDELGEVYDTGIYNIVTSGEVGRDEEDVRDGDVLEVRGVKDGMEFTETYEVRVDSGGCHPQELIGPDPLTIEFEGDSEE